MALSDTLILLATALLYITVSSSPRLPQKPILIDCAISYPVSVRQNLHLHTIVLYPCLPLFALDISETCPRHPYSTLASIDTYVLSFNRTTRLKLCTTSSTFCICISRSPVDKALEPIPPQRYSDTYITKA